MKKKSRNTVRNKLLMIFGFSLVLPAVYFAAIAFYNILVYALIPTIGPIIEFPLGYPPTIFECGADNVFKTIPLAILGMLILKKVSEEK